MKGKFCPVDKTTFCQKRDCGDCHIWIKSREAGAQVMSLVFVIGGATMGGIFAAIFIIGGCAVP